MSNTPDFDAILNADTGLDKSSNDPQKSPEDKLSMIENSTISNLGPMQKMLRGTEVRGTTVGGSKFEESYLVDSIPFVMRTRIKNQIFDVLDKSGQDYANVQVRGSDSFSKIEREIWTKKLGTTLDAIRRQKTTSGASLSVLEGLSNILEKSTEIMRAQWEERAIESREYLDKRNIFQKVAGLGRKRRFDKYSKKFLQNLEDKKSQIQASLNMVKLRKENDINDAKNKLQAKLAVHNNKDSSQRNALWKFVTANVANPENPEAVVDSRGNAVTIRSFGIKDRGDFLEALVALGYTTKADQLERTASLSEDSENVIDKFASGEQTFNDTLNKEDSKKVSGTVKKELELFVSPAKDSVESLPKLVADLEKTIRSKELSFVEKVYGKEKIYTPQQKLWKIMTYLSVNKDIIKGLNRTTLQGFLRYLRDVDKDTKLEQTTDNYAEQADSYLDITLLELKKIWTWDEKKSLSGLATTEKFEDALTNIEQLEWIIRNNSRKFESIKGKLSDELSAKYENKWSTVNEIRKKLFEEGLLTNWRKQKRLAVQWSAEGGDNLHQKIKDLQDAVDGFTKSKSPIEIKVQKDKIDELQRLRNLRTAIGETGGSVEDGPRQPSAMVLEEMFEEAFGFASKEDLLKEGTDWAQKRKDIKKRISEYFAPSSSTEDFDVRFRDYLMEQNQSEQESQLEKTLKENTTRQWNVLNMAPEGEFITLSYHDTLGVSTLPSAKELKEKQKGTPPIDGLRIIKKTEKGIVLEDPEDNGKTYVLSGPTERKDGVWVPNVGVYNQKGAKIQPGSSVSGIMLGLNLNA